MQLNRAVVQSYITWGAVRRSNFPGFGPQPGYG